MNWPETTRTIKPDGSKARYEPPLVPGDKRLDPTYLREHRDFFRSHCVKIITKNKGLQPFIPNYTQRVIWKTICDLRARGIPPRLIILKSRQVGVSTFSAVMFFEDAIINPYRTGLIVAHSEDDAKGLFRMARVMNHYLPKELRQPERLDNVKEMEFSNLSRLRVDTEGDIRSMTAHKFHGSEFAFWKKPRETLTAALQTMPNDPETLGVLESTANGQGNLFHELWIRAVNREKDPDVAEWEQGWVPVFIPWWRHEEYKMPARFPASALDEEERALRAKFRCTMEQLAWRRWCIEHNCNGDVETFRVEYPATWQEAFALSGRPIFTEAQIDHYAALCPPARQDSLWDRSGPKEIEWDEPTKRPRIEVVPGGRFRLFKEPNARHSYIIFADPSEGDRKSDPTPFEVLDQMTLEFVAEWHGRCPPDVLAHYAAWAGWYFNEAMIGGEANNHGILFFSTLLELGYPNLYFRETHEESVSGEKTMKPGLFQTNKTKHALIDTFRRYVREKRGGIYSPILIGEMRTAQYERKDEAQATKITKPDGAHIDAVICAAGALYLHRGSIENPLVPLPEQEIVNAAIKVAMLRDRDPAGAEAYALDATGMTGAELEAIFEVRAQRKKRQEVFHRGGQR